MNVSTQQSIVLEAHDVPGLQLCLLQGQMSQSVYELDIDQLINWVEGLQLRSSHPYQITQILVCLRTYKHTCPALRYLQLIYPWYGGVPYIDIKINSEIGCSAKVHLSELLVKDFLGKYIDVSWGSAETTNRNVT